MIYHKRLNKYYKTRLEAKQDLGGTWKFNEALKNGDLVFINEDKKPNKKDLDG
jgi:hypothetical protein